MKFLKYFLLLSIIANMNLKAMKFNCNSQRAIYNRPLTSFENGNNRFCNTRYKHQFETLETHKQMRQYATINSEELKSFFAYDFSQLGKTWQEKITINEDETTLTIKNKLILKNDCSIFLKALKNNEREIIAFFLPALVDSRYCRDAVIKHMLSWKNNELSTNIISFCETISDLCKEESLDSKNIFIDLFNSLFDRSLTYELVWHDPVLNIFSQYLKFHHKALFYEKNLNIKSRFCLAIKKNNWSMLKWLFALDIDLNKLEFSSKSLLCEAIEAAQFVPSIEEWEFSPYIVEIINILLEHNYSLSEQEVNKFLDIATKVDASWKDKARAELASFIYLYKSGNKYLSSYSCTNTPPKILPSIDPFLAMTLP